jgi:hypothetical protein
MDTRHIPQHTEFRFAFLFELNNETQICCNPLC